MLKIVDFGVSEMFEKPGDPMKTAKSAGSPAFLAPELCVVRHGDVDGKATDIWSMGISLYCLRYGKIPFEQEGVLEMYEAIKTDSPELPEDENPDFVDLISRILEKDPQKRIQMHELRVSTSSSSVALGFLFADHEPGPSVGYETGDRSSAIKGRKLLKPRRAPKRA